MAGYAAIVLSAGSGRRMNSDTPKQYLPLAGKPVVYHCLKAFQESPVSEIVLVAGAADLDYCRRELVEKYQLDKVKKIVPGGAERYDSVFEGLKAIQKADYVMIHDGARPVLTQEIIARSMSAVAEYQACIAGMPVKDTIKIADEEGFAEYTPKRSSLWMIQTPQTFSFPLIYNAYKKALSRAEQEKRPKTLITDDAMVLETFGNARVKLIEGSYKNIKITTPEDLAMAELFLAEIDAAKEAAKKSSDENNNETP